MDEVTQQNAALVEQAAAAAESLEEQAEKLVDAVSKFQLDESVAPVERRAASRATNVERLPKGDPRKPQAQAPAKPGHKRLANGAGHGDGKPMPKRVAKVAAGGADDEWEEF
jgi:methyl-accepting chemotaxis protein